MSTWHTPLVEDGLVSWSKVVNLRSTIHAAAKRHVLSWSVLCRLNRLSTAHRVEGVKKIFVRGRWCDQKESIKGLNWHISSRGGLRSFFAMRGKRFITFRSALVVCKTSARILLRSDMRSQVAFRYSSIFLKILFVNLVKLKLIGEPPHLYSFFFYF